MRTSHWLGIIGFLVLLLVTAELNRTGSLGEAFWIIYVSVSVLSFTAAWVSLTCCAVIWVYRLAVRGDEESKQDLIKAARERYSTLYSAAATRR